MYRQSFPKCTILGELSPSKMITHLASTFAVPKKCISCKFLFEGECLRNYEQTDGYLRLDYGPCGINGRTEPELLLETSTGNKIFVPSKCKTCSFLHLDEIGGYVCKKDKHLWGDSFRDFDWGNWTPSYPNVGLNKFSDKGNQQFYRGQAIITKEVIQLIQEGEKTKALILYKKLNQIETIKEAKDDIDNLEAKINLAT